MASLEQAVATQLKNIEAKTGRSLAALYEMLSASGLEKVSEQRKHLMDTLGLGYGDANTVALMARKAAEVPAASTNASDDPLDAIYAGPKAALRPLHDALMARIKTFGAFEAAPKKSYISLRRKKQFAMLGPATKTAIEIGLNCKALPPHGRLKVMPPATMCQATARIEGSAEIDAELLRWVRQAFDEAG
jgi:hypothetical protein